MARTAKQILAIRKNKQLDEQVRSLEEEVKELEEQKVEVPEIEEAEAERATDEELAAVVAEADDAEAKNTEIDEKIDALKEEIKKLEEQKVDVPADEEEEEQPQKSNEERGNKTMNEVLKRSYKNKEGVVTFLRQFKTAVEQRSQAGQDLLVPEEIIRYVDDMIVKESVLYGKVTVRKTSANVRVTFNARGGKAIWTEKCADITSELNNTFTDITFDQFKLAAFDKICNADLEDLAILEDFIIESLGTAFAQALDQAILKGDGTGMPEGILKNADIVKAKKVIKKDHVLEVLKAATKVRAKNKVIYMNQDTYNDFILTPLYEKDNGINVAVFGMPAEQLGKIKIEVIEKFDDVELLANGQVLVGDLKKYQLVERQNKHIAKSTEYKFLEDHTYYKITGRYDGKVLDARAFQLLELSNTPS